MSGHSKFKSSERQPVNIRRARCFIRSRVLKVDPPELGKRDMPLCILFLQTELLPSHRDFHRLPDQFSSFSIRGLGGSPGVPACDWVPKADMPGTVLLAAKEIHVLKVEA